jgi:hypothetical protein
MDDDDDSLALEMKISLRSDNLLLLPSVSSLVAEETSSLVVDVAGRRSVNFKEPADTFPS